VPGRACPRLYRGSSSASFPFSVLPRFRRGTQGCLIPWAADVLVCPIIRLAQPPVVASGLVPGPPKAEQGCDLTPATTRLHLIIQGSSTNLLTYSTLEARDIKQTTWLWVLAAMLWTGETHAQSEYISSKEVASVFSVGFTRQSGSKTISFGGGGTVNEWADAEFALFLSDPGSDARSLAGPGVGLRPFVRVAESNHVSVLLGTPLSVELLVTSFTGTESEYGTFGSYGAGLYLSLRGEGASVLVLSVVRSHTDYLSGELHLDGGVNAIHFGVERSIAMGEGGLLMIGLGTSLEENVDDPTLHFELGLLFPKLKQ
jgi:hypothetical protein